MFGLGYPDRETLTKSPPINLKEVSEDECKLSFDSLYLMVIGGVDEQKYRNIQVDDGK